METKPYSPSSALAGPNGSGAPPDVRRQFLQSLGANGKPPSPSRRFIGYSLADLAARPSKPWMVSRVVRPREMGMIYGASGAGKSFIAIDLIVCLVLGRRWADCFDVPRSLRVAYVAGEGTEMVCARFAAAFDNLGVDPEGVDGLDIFDKPVQLVDGAEDGVEAFLADVLHSSKRSADVRESAVYDLVVFDTLHSCSVGIDENSARDVGRVIKACKLVTERLGAAVVIVHHANRAGSGERGSSALRAACDFILEVAIPKGASDDDPERTLSCSKLKDGRWWKPLSFHVLSAGDDDSDSAFVQWAGLRHTGRPREQSGTRRTILKLLSNRWASNGTIADELNLAESTVKDQTRAMEREGLLERRHRKPKGFEYRQASAVEPTDDQTDDTTVNLDW